MSTEIAEDLIEHGSSSPTAAPEGLRERIVRYYAATGEDYAAWSPGYHMHFGYWRRGLAPTALEPMLVEMTLQVARRLDIEAHERPRVVDLGCGLGASSRVLARNRPRLDLDAVTVVPWQVERARALAAAAGVGDRIRFAAMDYTATRFEDGTFDGAFAIESACHARGPAKVDFVREAFRLLAPGARLVVADGFLRRRPPRRGPWRWCLDRVQRHWALETFADLDAFRAALHDAGFEDVEVEDVSWRVAPSVAHVPRVTVAFLWRELRRSGLRMGRDRWGHVLASVLSPLLGIARRRFGYYLVRARKPSAGAAKP